MGSPRPCVSSIRQGKNIKTRLNHLRKIKDIEYGAGLRNSTFERIRETLKRHGYVTDTETITDFDLLLTIANSNNPNITAKSHYGGIP